jgi:hypothetical protein
MLMVMTVAGTTVFVLSNANARSATGSKASEASYSLAEAGLADAFSKLANADDPTDSSVLATTTLTLGAGTATYAGTLSGQTWTITSTGRIANPTSAAPSEVQRTLTRTVAINDPSVGTFSNPNWARMHQDYIFSCFDIPVNIPVDVTSVLGICVQPGGSITGANTKVSAGFWVSQDGYALVSGPRSTTNATGTSWTTPGNVGVSDNAKATYSIPGNGQSSNLDITNFGFSIPAGSTIDGITVRAEVSANGTSVDDDTVMLLKNGAAVGNDYASGTDWSTTDATRTYGDSNDRWGTSWTPADINAGNFGVRLKVDSDVAATRIASVDYVTITVDYHGPPGGIGSLGTPVASFNAPECQSNGGSWHHPCDSTDSVYANTVTDNLAIAFKPRINWSFWYTNAGLGPKKGCTETSGTPPAFDTNSSMDGSNPVKELTPETGDYTCRRRDAAGNIVGELSWNRTTRVLKVLGPIFFDGGVDFQGSTSPVHYQGRGTIWATEQVRINEAVCAGGTGMTNCRSAMSSWDSNTNNLLLVAGGEMGWFSDSVIVNTDAAAFQGMLYGKYDCTFTNNVQISAPVLCSRIDINTGATSPVFNTFTMPTQQASGQAYVGGTTSDMQLVIGNQTG